jgi:hypothetical protein
MGRPIIPLKMTEEERTGTELSAWFRSRQMPAAEQQRARMVLLNTKGLSGQVTTNPHQTNSLDVAFYARVTNALRVRKLGARQTLSTIASFLIVFVVSRKIYFN